MGEDEDLEGDKDQVGLRRFLEFSPEVLMGHLSRSMPGLPGEMYGRIYNSIITQLKSQSLIPDREQSFGEYLRLLREKRQMSQAELAAKAALDPSYIGRIERGSYAPPKISTIQRIAAALELNLIDYETLLQASGRIPTLAPIPVDTQRLERQLSEWEDSLRNLQEAASDLVVNIGTLLTSITSVRSKIANQNELQPDEAGREAAAKRKASTEGAKRPEIDPGSDG